MRVGGNLMWKVRWDGENNGQTSYNHGRRTEDPMYAEGKREQLTVGWDHFESPTENPVTTWGVNGRKGVYANTGGATPRGSGGFTVYRNKHWAFEGTDLYYGDILGRIVPVVGFEVDGVDYTFRHGLPYPTGEDGAPDTLEILALAPAVQAEEIDQGHHEGASEGEQHVGESIGTRIAQGRYAGRCSLRHHVECGRTGHGTGRRAQQQCRAHAQRPAPEQIGRQRGQQRDQDSTDDDERPDGGEGLHHTAACIESDRRHDRHQACAP
jgi:hypothetical protein